MEGKEYIVYSLTYEGFAGEACDRMAIYKTFAEALADYEYAKSVIGDGYYDSSVRIFVRKNGGNGAYLIRAYCPSSQSVEDTYYRENWNGCELIRDESKIIF